jgi:hypothetical protein
MPYLVRENSDSLASHTGEKCSAYILQFHLLLACKRVGLDLRPVIELSDEICTREIKFRIAMAKAEFDKKAFTSKLRLNLRNW